MSLAPDRPEVFPPSPIYFDRIAAAGDRRGRVVMLHGGALSGRCYLETAGGRQGWAYGFADRGFETLVIDWPGTGRSGYMPASERTGSAVSDAIGELLIQMPGPSILLVHSMSGPYGFCIASRHRSALSALIAIAPGPPGDVQQAPLILERTQASIKVEGASGSMTLPTTGNWHPPIGFVEGKFIGKSRRFDRDLLRAYYRTVGSVPAELILERVNVDHRQLRLGDRTDFAGLPMLILTGSEDADHPRETDAITAAWMAGHGARVDHRFLDEGSVGGNGHCPMSEANSDDWVDLMCAWMETSAR